MILLKEKKKPREREQERFTNPVLSLGNLILAARVMGESLKIRLKGQKTKVSLLPSCC